MYNFGAHPSPQVESWQLTLPRDCSWQNFRWVSHRLRNLRCARTIVFSVTSICRYCSAAIPQHQNTFGRYIFEVFMCDQCLYAIQVAGDVHRVNCKKNDVVFVDAKLLHGPSVWVRIANRLWLCICKRLAFECRLFTFKISAAGTLVSVAVTHRSLFRWCLQCKKQYRNNRIDRRKCSFRWCWYNLRLGSNFRN